jgi:inosine-uridine nucleoside N-ribohydrolase
MAVRCARALVCTALAIAIVHGQPAPAHRIIFDTDFALPPQDDGLALAFALNSPELEILGGGNATPAAEFNFWVDPEAARIVLRSGIPITLSPLNVSRKTLFDKTAYDAVIAAKTPVTRLLELQMGPRYARDVNFHPHMYDEVAVASLVDPTLVKTRHMIVDVDDRHGIDYGASIGGDEPWPGTDGAVTIDVQYDIDAARFMKVFIARLAQRR